METLPQPMARFIEDREFEAEVGDFYGTYLVTFLSARGEVRADLFDEGHQVVAHVSYPTGLSAVTVEDRYVSDLYEYAERQGFADRFHLVFS